MNKGERIVDRGGIMRSKIRTPSWFLRWELSFIRSLKMSFTGWSSLMSFTGWSSLLKDERSYKHEKDSGLLKRGLRSRRTQWFIHPSSTEEEGENKCLSFEWFTETQRRLRTYRYRNCQIASHPWCRLRELALHTSLNAAAIQMHTTRIRIKVLPSKLRTSVLTIAHACTSEGHVSSYYLEAGITLLK